jgi:hypothetical protein
MRTGIVKKKAINSEEGVVEKTLADFSKEQKIENMATMVGNGSVDLDEVAKACGFAILKKSDRDLLADHKDAMEVLSSFPGASLGEKAKACSEIVKNYQAEEGLRDFRKCALERFGDIGEENLEVVTKLSGYEPGKEVGKCLDLVAKHEIVKNMISQKTSQGAPFAGSPQAATETEGCFTFYEGLGG